MILRFAILLIAACHSAALLAADPVGWRMDGRSDFSTAKPQTQWGPADRVVWATPLQQWSNAGPVLVGDKIFVCAEPSTLLCLDSSGKILWQHSADYSDLPASPAAELEKNRATLTAERLPEQVAELQAGIAAKKAQLTQLKADAAVKNDDPEAKAKVDAMVIEIAPLEQQEKGITERIQALTPASERKLPPTHPDNGYTSATPACDGKFVYAAFGSGIVVCYDMDGTRQWIRLFPENTHRVWGNASSPVLVGNMLITHYLDMVALDAGTGKELWRAQYGHNWGTPAIVSLGKLTLLITDGGDVVNAADGKAMATTMKLTYCSPLAKDDVVYCADMGKAQAFRLAVDNQGQGTSKMLWETNVTGSRRYASPLLVDGFLYLVNKDSVLDVVDAATGKIAYQQKLALGGTAYSSPVQAGNVVIVSSDKGKSAVIKPGPDFEEIARCTLEPFRATPVCNGARMLVRTCSKGSKLYCIGE
ncbi:MAG: PQQ-binding-like beta-propeller repeat protein [Verrucomicrobiae bacterium]